MVEQILKDYDYLFISHADDKFENNFSPLFGSFVVEDGSLFQVLKGNRQGELKRLLTASD